MHAHVHVHFVTGSASYNILNKVCKRQTANLGWLASVSPSSRCPVALQLARLIYTCVHCILWGSQPSRALHNVPTLHTLQFTVLSQKWIMPLWVVTSRSYCTPCRAKILVLMQYIPTTCSGTWMYSPKLSKIKQRYMYMCICYIHVAYIYKRARTFTCTCTSLYKWTCIQTEPNHVGLSSAIHCIIIPACDILITHSTDGTNAKYMWVINKWSWHMCIYMRIYILPAWDGTRTLYTSFVYMHTWTCNATVLWIYLPGSKLGTLL